MRFTLLATTLVAFAAPDGLRAEGQGAVAEIVTFRLSEGADPAAFAASAAEMTPFLEESGAVMSRTLSVDDTGQWTDHIVWKTRDAAETAAAQIMQRTEAQPFMAFIDPSTVDLRHAAIRFEMPPE